MRRCCLLSVLALAGCGRLEFAALSAPDTGIDASGDAVVTTGNVTFVKPSDTAENAQFGHSIALSATGDVLAVGAPLQTSEAGAVYVFRRTGGTWMQEQIITALNAEVGDQFGWSVALAAEGTRLVVGARREDSAVPTNPVNNGAMSSGAAYVFDYAGSTWSQVAYLKASTPLVGASFGERVTISGDGSVIVVGAPDASVNAGSVHVFTEPTYAEQATFAPPGVDAGDEFGYRLALSAGGLLVVGAYREDSTARGVPATPGDDGATNSGAAYAYQRAGMTWNPDVTIKSSDSAAGDNFGYGVALTPDGATVAIAGPSGGGTVGQIYVFQTSPWEEVAILRAEHAEAGDEIGYCLALTADGDTLIAGSILEDSNATGIGPPTSDNSLTNSGAVHMFQRQGTTWTQTAVIKASNPGAGDFFGWSCAIAGDGSVIAVGASLEDSGTTGIDAPSDETAPDSGAVYIFE